MSELIPSTENDESLQALLGYLSELVRLVRQQALYADGTLQAQTC